MNQALVAVCRKKGCAKCLKRDNTLYENITIDEDLLYSWPEAFVRQDIIDLRVLVEDVKGDAAECSGYAIQYEDKLDE